MEFDRAFNVAIKIFLVDFILYLFGVVLLVPFALSGYIQLIDIAIVVGAVLGLFGLAVTVYFILQETEKISRETESYVDTKRYDTQISDLRRMIDEISKTLPKETATKIEDIKTKKICPQCKKKVPKGFKMCPNCGAPLRH